MNTMLQSKFASKWQYEQKQQPKSEMCRQNLYGWSLMLWDGLGFFGTDHMKLGRLKGEKVNFFTFLKSPRSVVMSILGLALAIYIIINEGSKLGKEKSQTITLEPSQEYYYDFSDVIPLHGANWFFQNQIWDHIRKAQLKNLDETDPKIKDKLREHPTLPEGVTFDDLSEEDKNFVEEYLCNRTDLAYE